jgi:hypothetical protein
MPKKPDRDRDWQDLIIKTGYRELAKKHHPDAGGEEKDFQALSDARDALLDGGRVTRVPQISDYGEGVELQLQMEHISTLLTGRSVLWKGPNGFKVQLQLKGGPSTLVADALGKLVEKYVKPRR